MDIGQVDIRYFKSSIDKIQTTVNAVAEIGEVGEVVDNKGILQW